MKWRVLLVAFALFRAELSQAAENPPTIREFSPATVVKLGHAMYRQDHAAWVATDALSARVGDPRAAGIRGWIVVEAGPNQRVRFLRSGGEGAEVAYDVAVTPSGKVALSEPTDRTLSDTERAMWSARQTALAGGATLCNPGYNTVVLPDPERPGWLVWLLAPMLKADTIPIGIHYRFSVSKDGSRVLQRDALTRSCATLDPREGSQEGKVPNAVVVTHLVSAQPVETHVFLQLQAGFAMYVMTGKGIWAVKDGAITLLDSRVP